MTKFHTVEEAKQHLRDNWLAGTKCPCCNQNVKLYERKIDGRCAKSLIELYQFDDQRPDYYHVGDLPTYYKGGGDFAKLRFWGLIEEKPKDPDDSTRRTSGFWRITDRGRDFVEGRITVPRTVMIYNRKFYGYEDEKDVVSIKQCLGTQFNYEETMKPLNPTKQPTLI